MCEARVRRLPVLDFNDRLAGVISLDDLALQAREECRPPLYLERQSVNRPTVHGTWWIFQTVTTSRL